MDGACKQLLPQGVDPRHQRHGKGRLGLVALEVAGAATG